MTREKTGALEALLVSPSVAKVSYSNAARLRHCACTRHRYKFTCKSVKVKPVCQK